MTNWTTIVYSKSEDEYTENVEAFKENWLATHLEDIAYIESSWLIPRNRDRLVSAWVDKHLHLDNTATSKAEGIHGTIKADIHSKNIDLLYAWDVINSVVSRQLKAIDQVQRRQRKDTKPHYEYPVFDLVRHSVSFHAMDLAYSQFKMATTMAEDDKCKERFTRSIGIPCRHLIKKRLDTDEPLRLTDFDSSYHLRAFDGVKYHQPTLPPIKRPGRVYRQNGSRTSTRRTESAFELAARETAQRVAYENGKRPMKCSICTPEQRWGHKKNIIICPKHPRHSDWLASQGNTSNTPSLAQNITQQSCRQDQPQAETKDIIEVNTGRASTELYDSDDPDFQLEQYIPRIETTTTGFRRYIKGRDPSELPASK
jgi:hypothetical protein